MPVSAQGLAYEWYGDDGLPPLVLASGLGGLGGYWEPNLGALSQDYRVLTYDQRGCGGSTSDANPTVAAMAADLAALLDELALDEAPGLVGHALGGMIGLQLAMDRPELVLRVMMVNGWASLDPHTARCFDTRLALLRDSGPAAYLRATPLFLYPPAWVSAHDAALLTEETEARAYLPAAAVIEARVHAARLFDPGAYRLGAVATPVMCLASEDDALVPAHCSEALTKLLPHATLASFASGGHAVNVTRPDDFNARVQDWLR
ncbi:pyrimidine utilization protein D [Sphingomonas sp.]|uniref:pyrimidine utilization protein D n=1 Tax=Sphingomonas sp. TaxID=28214 RepID=UPI003CC504C0